MTDPNETLIERQANGIAGPAIRLKAHRDQMLAVLGCLILGGLLGFSTCDDPIQGALVGGALGLLVGLFGSGVFLMVYWIIECACGERD